MTDTSAEAVERLHERLGGVTVPEHMHGDNLAILLCSFFEDHEEEIGENGWTDAAIAGQDAVLDAIRGHYRPTLLSLAAERDALRARAEAAEAERDRLRTLLRRVPASLNAAFAAGTEERENGSARRQRKLMEHVEALRVEIRAVLTAPHQEAARFTEAVSILAGASFPPQKPRRG